MTQVGGTSFGLFFDVGCAKNGLCHGSQLVCKHPLPSLDRVLSFLLLRQESYAASHVLWHMQHQTPAAVKVKSLQIVVIQGVLSQVWSWMAVDSHLSKALPLLRSLCLHHDASLTADITWADDRHFHKKVFFSPGFSVGH